MHNIPGLDEYLLREPEEQYCEECGKNLGWHDADEDLVCSSKKALAKAPEKGLGFLVRLKNDTWSWWGFEDICDGREFYAVSFDGEIIEKHGI